MSKPRMLQGVFTLWISTNPTLTVYSASLLEVMRWKMLSMTFGMTPCVLPPGVKALPIVYVLPDPVWPYANTAGRQAELIDPCIDSKCVYATCSNQPALFVIHLLRQATHLACKHTMFVHPTLLAVVRCITRMVRCMLICASRLRIPVAL